MSRVARPTVSLRHDFARPGVIEDASDMFRLACGLETWFRVPEQGMEEYEILSRGSAFVTPASTSSPWEYHVVGTAHVTHPWRFPEFYAEEWLQFVEEKHTVTRLSVREPHTGRVLWETQLAQRAHVHEEEDLVLLHFEGEQEPEALRRGDVLPLVLSDAPSASVPTTLVGCDKREDALVPIAINGTLLGDKVVDTGDTLSPMGICGGPAVISAAQDFQLAAAAGIVHARVTAGADSIVGKTLLVTSKTISDFCAQVERAAKD